MAKKIIDRWHQHRGSILILLAIAGAQAPSLLIGRTQPGQSVDCDAGWIGQTINRARQELSPQPTGIPEGERRQMAEVYRVPEDQIRLSDPQPTAPRSVAPSAQSFKPVSRPPERVSMTESSAAPAMQAEAPKPAKARITDATEARMKLTTMGYGAIDVLNMDDATAIDAANNGRGL